MTLAIVDFYQVLRVPRDALLLDVKQAYHRILLSSHPDKRKDESPDSPAFDVGLIQQAYMTLSNPEARKAYDALLAARSASGPRPAQVLSLEEFTESIDDAGIGHWSYSCRCGGTYHIDDVQLEADVHLLGCESCSEVIWVGYEAESVDETEVAQRGAMQ